MGYYQAGFDVIGVDINPQPHYPFTFYQGDAVEFIMKYGDLFSAIHASPPCQFATKAAKQWRLAGKEYLNLIEATRAAIGNKPYVIENVPDAAGWLHDPIALNGGFFSLNVLRTRLFECSFPVHQPVLPKMKAAVKMGRPVKDGDVIQPVGHCSNVPYARKQMGIDWMNQGELAQAIPPAYTKFIGKQLIQYLKEHA